MLNYEVIRWWEVECASIVEKHAVHLYTLLPASKDPTVALLKQALQEMFQTYERHQLGYRFMWFYRILRRTDTMSEEDRQIIEEELKMQYNYQELIQDDPIIQNLLAETHRKGEAQGEAQGEARGEARGRAEGRAEGELLNMRKTIMSILNARFPLLAAASQTRQVIASIQDIGRLEVIQQALLYVSDEQVARQLLESTQQDLI